MIPQLYFLKLNYKLDAQYYCAQLFTITMTIISNFKVKMHSTYNKLISPPSPGSKPANSKTKINVTIYIEQILGT